MTNFLFFGSFGIDYFFHMYFLYVGALSPPPAGRLQPLTVLCACSSRIRYSRSLEEGSFRGRTADFLFFLLIGGSLMLVRALVAVHDLHCPEDGDVACACSSSFPL